MKRSEIPFLSATELSQFIAAKEVSPVEATEAYLERIEQVDHKLHAYITVCGDEARAAAREAERAIASGRRRGPMHGIPIAVKDQFWTKGIRTTGGSTILKNFVPQEDSTVMAKMKQAGAILLGKLTLTEFAMVMPYRYPYGTPTNPWDLTRVPGGSSAGSGSATAASLCATSLGEDTGGSIRGPASFCGIVGLRPSYGRVSRYGLLGSCWSMDTIGPMSRTVEDCAMTLGVIAGHDPKDPYTWNTPVPNYVAALKDSIRDLRVGVVRDRMDTSLVEPDILKATVEAIEVIRELGASVTEVSLPLIPHAAVISSIISMVESASVHRQYIREQLAEYDHNMRIHLLSASLMPAQAYYKAQRLREVFRRQVQEVMKTVDVLVYPTSSIPATPIIDKPGLGTREYIKKDLYGRRSFTNPVNLANAPALSVPCGFTSNGLPIGLQIIGRPFEEATVLRLGHAYEQATEWHTRRPPI